MLEAAGNSMKRQRTAAQMALNAIVRDARKVRIPLLDDHQPHLNSPAASFAQTCPRVETCLVESDTTLDKACGGPIEYLTHRGKPPAPPGDSPRFGICDGLRELFNLCQEKGDSR